jgi:putative copper resistance protein D
LEHRPVLLFLTALHQAATACWIGAMPYLVLALARAADSRALPIPSLRSVSATGSRASP